MYESVCYKKPFLKEVIARINFPSPIIELEKKFPTAISSQALIRFPVLQPQKTQSQEFQFSAQEVHARTTESVDWVFFGTNREKKLVVNPLAFMVSIKQYKSYEELKEDIQKPMEALFTIYKDLRASRIELRYINILDPGDEDAFAWAKYVNSKMLCVIESSKDRESLSRAFHILEYNYHGQSLKCQFGIANPDYPAPIKRKQFILDMGSYFHGALDPQEILTNLDAAHERIQQFFEETITEETRKLMQPA